MLLTADWIFPIGGPPIRDGAIAVAGDRIVEVGPVAQLRARWGAGASPGAGQDLAAPSTGAASSARDVRHFPGCALMPGLINVHSHLEYSAFQGSSRPCGFGEWMLRLLLARRKLTPEDYLVSARWGARQCLRAGMTYLADTSFEGWTSARAAGEAGLRARVHLEVMGVDDARLPRVMARMEERLTALRDACGPLVDPGLSPHAPYTVSARLYREVTRFATRAGMHTATHVAESPAEVEMLQKGTGAIAYAHKAARLWQGHRWAPPGLSPIVYVWKAGGLTPDTLAVHCVQVDAGDIARLADSGAAVAHCPRSNARLQCGASPVAELRQAGVRVGLGTDSLASNDSLDIFAEMRAALEMSRARTAAAAPPLDEETVLRMATLEAAAALGLDDRLGSLDAGKQADMIAVRVPKTGADPAGALVSAVRASDVRMTMVAGKVLFDSEAAQLASDYVEEEFVLVRRKLGLGPLDGTAGPLHPS